MNSLKKENILKAYVYVLGKAEEENVKKGEDRTAAVFFKAFFPP